MKVKDKINTCWQYSADCTKSYLGALLFRSSSIVGIVIALFTIGTTAGAEQKPLSIAVLNFDVSSADIQVKGADVAILVTTQLSNNPEFLVAERAEVDKALGEQALGLSGTVDTATAAKIGRLTGVQVLISGRVFKALNETLLVSKLMSTENGRVYGEMVTVADGSSLAKAVAELSSKLEATLESKGSTLVTVPEAIDDFMARLRLLVLNKKLPSLTISLPEVSLGAASIDPAAETEFQRLLGQLGYTVLDRTVATGSPELEVKGEAVSQIALRKGGLVSARGRVEAKVVDRATGKILWSDSETTVAVDISDEIASKTSLQIASRRLIERMVTQLNPK